MAARLTFFRVGNGDMTLIQTQGGHQVLVDANIRDAADDPDGEHPDVGAQLRKRLNRDGHGRYFVDALLLSHPDQDHSNGLNAHFHLGPPADFPSTSDKIFIREMWSSERVISRAESDKDRPLCEDAKAFIKEYRRRINLIKSGRTAGNGDRALRLGDLEASDPPALRGVSYGVDDAFNKINGEVDNWVEVRVRGPLAQGKDEPEEELIAKNRSSVILQVAFSAGFDTEAVLYLTGGDAEVEVWKRLWRRLKSTPEKLAYDLMLAPHHCSWHSLSSDSIGDLGTKAKVDPEARQALGQARQGAYIVSSSKPIKNDDDDPPSYRAKQEYEAIAKNVGGSFLCVTEHNGEHAEDPIEFEVAASGAVLVATAAAAATLTSPGAIGRQPLGHGSR